MPMPTISRTGLARSDRVGPIRISIIPDLRGSIGEDASGLPMQPTYGRTAYRGGGCMSVVSPNLFLQRGRPEVCPTQKPWPTAVAAALWGAPAVAHRGLQGSP
jgi:hypothetical protein